MLPENYRVIGDGVTAFPPPDGTKIVVPRNRLLYFDPNAFRNRVIQIPTGYVADPYFYGTAPTYFFNLRMFGMNDTNLSLAREFPGAIPSAAPGRGFQRVQPHHFRSTRP